MPHRSTRILPFLGTATLLALPATALAQARPDSAPPEPYRLDELVVVADRYATALRGTVAATSLLTRADLDALPATTLAQALESVPGLLFVEQDGSGRQPIAIARGFFGGGETSYVLLTIDGVPANDGRTGLVEWSRIPLEDVQRIEVLRGSASVSYGDAALGAVINVVTRRAAPRGGLAGRTAISVSSWSGAGLHAAAGSELGSRALDATVDYDREEGFRAHSRSNELTTSLSLGPSEAPGADGLSGRLAFSRRFNEDPGPVPEIGGSFDRRGSHPAFAGDERTRETAEASIRSRHSWADGPRLDGAVRLRWYDQQRTRTLLLTPSFGDTQDQSDREVGLWARTQLAEPLGPALLHLGAEAEGTSFRTRYTMPGTGTLLTSGDGHEWKLGLFGELSGSPVERLRLVGGMRFDAVLPRDEAPAAEASRSFHQWSPRVGANLAYREDPASPGNVYLSWTRAFKAPTLDQLFDVRAIPTGAPGQTISISNGELRPERSTAVEAGVYQRLPLGGGPYAELSLSAYRQWLDDEIDFDLLTYRYGNIVASRHTGAELSARVVLSRRIEVTHAATLGRAVFRTSANRGHQLKNIPESAFTTTARIAVADPVSLTLTHRAMGRVWLDDENTQALSGSSRFDAAVRWRVGRLGARFSVRNIFDAEYGGYGYLLYDPFSNENVRMIRPGMGRAIDFRLDVGS
ncbi:MAG: TonB-dependent receptor [Candidatus Palauibacterales bacterium]|nr:TonB-dependent receptor [Candidatus Palauibacterales bacterium]MDP2529132.1 TonB-dependent receptor [Candidatus Palauibacterales bacterium]MDP2583921.1 TonB-dependent receptor [Candidatus Palauibacterales bacterium]